MTGKRFGRLVVKEAAERIRMPTGKTRIMWKCLCDCGNECLVYGVYLRCGYTTSCGCRYRESIGSIAYRHGKSKSREYQSWQHMKGRCTRQTNQNYADYGGRGIVICDRWQNFETFLADMGPAPAGATIDRIDNNGNYEPANCRWASRYDQSRNKRNTVHLTLGDRTQHITAWARELGMAPATLRLRLRNGWSMDRALTTPPRKMTKRL